MKRLAILFFLLPGFLVGWEWSSPKGDLKISLSPEELNIGEKSILRVETSGVLVDKKKLVEKLLGPLNNFSEKIKIESMNQEEGSLTLVLIPLVEGTLSIHLESVPLSDGKVIDGQEAQLKVSMPDIVLHRLLTAAAKPLPLNRQPIVDLSSDNRYSYVDGERALDEEKAKAIKLFKAKRLPLGKFILILMILWGAIIAYFWRKEILIWLKATFIPAYNPQRYAEKAIHKATRLYSKDERFFVSISETLRRYFGEVFSVDVQDLTTPELMSAFETKEEISKESLQDLQDILVGADLVKFAQATPTQKAIESASSKAMKLIEDIGQQQKSQ